MFRSRSGKQSDRVRRTTVEAASSSTQDGGIGAWRHDCNSSHTQAAATAESYRLVQGDTGRHHDMSVSSVVNKATSVTNDSKTLTADIMASHLPVFTLDRELRYTAFNRAHAADMKELYGAEITLGSRLANYQSVTADRETARGNLMRALGGERVVASAYSGARGHERYIDVVHEPLTDAAGEVVGVEVRVFDATERQAVEKALQDSEERYRNLFEGAMEGIFQSSPEGKVLAANEVCARMLGYGSGADVVAEVVDSARQVWAQPDERSCFTALLCEKGVVRGYECQFVCKDGRRIWVSLSGQLVLGHDGEVVCYEGFVEDITDRHEAASRLETAAAQWRETFDAMGDSIALFDGDGRIVRCNAATVRLTGRSFADIIGHDCEEVFSDRDGGHCPRKRAFETGQVETDIIERGNAWLRVTFTPKIDATGQVVGGVHVATDITQLRQAEQSAAERSHFLEELLEAIPVPIFCLDATRRYTVENEAYAVSSGHSKGEIIGKTAFDVWPADLAASFDASDCELLNHPERPAEQELELADKDGSRHWLLTHKAVFSDVSGRPAGIVGVNLDVTEIRRAQQELAASAAQLELTLEGSVAALGATTELRDPYTAGHQRRVAELACAIALELGWDEVRLKSLRIAARLHDIGKIILPAEILAKPGRLSEIEMQLIRQHAAAGAEVVQLHRLRAKRGGDDPPAPRAPRRLGVPGRPTRRGDPAGVTNPRRRRRGRSDDQPQALPSGVADRGGPERDRGWRRNSL